MRSLKLSFSCLVFILLLSCNKNGANSQSPSGNSFFARGADISWLTEMENSGKLFYDSASNQSELLALLGQYNLNTIRLRVWVNPVAGWNSKQDVINKALRAKAKGMHIMIDFHYSDSWADPGQQNKPVAWQTAGFTTLKDSLRRHTTDVLGALKANGITPDWVQIGNETNDGMLWPDGRASTNMANFAALVNEGYQATKNIFPDAKVIVHLSNGFDNTMYRWLFDGLKANNANWDVIGLSLYPSPSNWPTLTQQCLSNMNDLVARYNKEVMVVEIGMSWDQSTQSRLFISDIIAKTKTVSQNKGIGVLYWEPQAYNWQSYTLGCFDLSGRPTGALNGFR